MKFSTREDIEAPIDVVYAQVTDFAAYERQALRRGADVNRVKQTNPLGVGTEWDVSFSFRGKDRRMHLTLAEMDEQRVRVDSSSAGLDGVSEIELVALSPAKTRITVGIELAAKTLTARLLLQSLKLAKANLTQRFKKRVGEFASEIEARHRRG